MISMHSQASSLCTDPEEDENIENCSLSCISYALDIPKDPLELIKFHEEELSEFPNVSISLSSSHSSEDVKTLLELNKEIKQAIRSSVTYLKAASKKIVDSPSPDNHESPQDFKEQYQSCCSIRIDSDLRLNSDLRTQETEENVEILQQIISNIKNLKNKRLKRI